MNNFKLILLTLFFCCLLIKPINAQTQRISCKGESFSIIPPTGWTLILEDEGVMVFQNPSNKAIMSFKKMPTQFSDLAAFTAEYKEMMEGTGSQLIPQEPEMINEIQVSKYNIQLPKKDAQAPNMQGQIYLFSANGGIYFLESFGPDVITSNADLFKRTAASFQLK